MSYLLTVLEPRGQRSERTLAEGRELYARMLAFGAKLEARGVLLAAEALTAETDGCRVSVREGRRTIVDVYRSAGNDRWVLPGRCRQPRRGTGHRRRLSGGAMGHRRSAQDRYLLRVVARPRCRPDVRPPVSAPAGGCLDHGGDHDDGRDTGSAARQAGVDATSPLRVPQRIAASAQGDGFVYAESARRQGPRGALARACCTRAENRCAGCVRAALGIPEPSVSSSG
jgi:hypothetical protein